MTSASCAAARAAQLECVLVSPPARMTAEGDRGRTIASIGPRGRSGLITTTIRSNAPDASAAWSDHASTGWPPRSAVILSVPARVELPAARMAQTAPVLAIDGTRPASLARFTLRVAEDHPAADRLKDAHRDLLARKDDRTDGFREVVHVEHRYALELGHAVEAVIIGHDRDAKALRERDELPVGAVPGGF